MLNALSVDVEDWFQVGAFEAVIRRDQWDGLEQRVERNAGAGLDLFAGAGGQAPLFPPGWGGWDHQRVFNLGEEGFRADLRRAHQAISEAAGAEPKGYRAPSFSIDARTPW